MGLKEFFGRIMPTTDTKAHLTSAEQDQVHNPYIAEGISSAMKPSDEIFKAYIPEFLYKPPYGYPRKVNLPFLKLLAKTSYIFSVIKTLTDEASSIPWEITVKDEFQDDGVDYAEQIKKITKFFNHPNGNPESFVDFLRMLIPGILEVDAGVIVKVFNVMGELDQMFVRDGASFLKNPNIFGYLGNRDDFIPPISMDLYTESQIRNLYSQELTRKAAYFQYGWTAGAMPVPFGKREIIYIIQNPRGDSVYGRSPVEILSDIIMNLDNSLSSSPRSSEEKIKFTRRELEVLNLICTGSSNVEIADKLFLSIRTIEGHKSKLISKTGVNNSIGLVMYALKNRIIEI